MVSGGWIGWCTVHTDDVMVGSPEVDIDCIEDAEQGEAPWDTVDNGAFAAGEELVDDSAGQEDVDQRPNWKLSRYPATLRIHTPDEESPGRRSDIGLLSIEVYGRGGGYSVYVWA